MLRKEVQQMVVTMVLKASHVYCCSSLKPPLANQTKTLAISEGYHAINTFL
jgi:hypothetical protein